MGFRLGALLIVLAVVVIFAAAATVEANLDQASATLVGIVCLMPLVMFGGPLLFALIVWRVPRRDK
jgi:hypothetical protein